MQRLYHTSRNRGDNAGENALTKSTLKPFHLSPATNKCMHHFSGLPLYPVPIQPKLTINQPNDMYEQEADAMADKVMRMPDKVLQVPGSGNDNIQRKCKECEEEEKGLQKKESSNTTFEASPLVHQTLRSNGHPMDVPTRNFMESRFGHDFSKVQIHNNTLANESAKNINALAYTYGNHIVFNSGQYSPGNSSGRKLLAHELTHVIQQQPRAHFKDRLTSSGGTLQRKAPDVFDTTDATAVKDSWAKDGASSESDISRALKPYTKWKQGYSKKVAAEKKKKAAKRTITDAQLTAIDTWLHTFEVHEQWKAMGTGKSEPADPGSAPAELASLGGNPPVPAYEKIKKYDVTIPGGSKYSYTDHVDSSNTIITSGVQNYGSIGGKAKISDVFDKAGVPAPDPAVVKKVFSVLSGLEGMFDAINTYDAGYISVGFIQFISGEKGTGSLSKVLRDMKAKNPTDFKTNFHDRGIDVDSAGLVVVAPADGTILHGSDAVQKIIDDKRLTAVFQDTGAKSDSFQQAEARTAYGEYYLPDKTFSIKVTVPETDPKAKKKTKDIALSGVYKDVLTSEAGKVAIVDRGVQHGVAGGHKSGGAGGRFLDACQEVVDKHSLADPKISDLVTYEKEIVTRLVNRYDVFADASLTQPPAVPAPAAPVTPAPAATVTPAPAAPVAPAPH